MRSAITGVIHFWQTYDAAVPANADDFTIIPFTKPFQCSAKLTTDCWVTKSASKNNVSPLWFQATFVTPDNDRSRVY